MNPTTCRRRLARGTPALALGSLLALQGCVGGLLDSEAPAEEAYRLGMPAPAAPAATSGQALAITVQRPRAPVVLDTSRIAIAPGGQRFDYYTGARWAEPAPLMLQQNLVAALESSGRFAGVFAAPSRTPAELTLDVELRHFEAVSSVADGAPTAVVQLQASLVDARRALRVTSFVSEARVPATANRRDAIIAAFERANADVVAEVVAKVGDAAAGVAPPASR
jgi:cholesterol transport system auxiliary component